MMMSESMISEMSGGIPLDGNKNEDDVAKKVGGGSSEASPQKHGYQVMIVGGVPQVVRMPSKEAKKPNVEFSPILRRKPKNSEFANRRISCKDLGAGDCQGWLYKNKEAKSFLGTSKWHKRWCVLKSHAFYVFNDENSIRAECLVCLPAFQVSPAPECKTKKYAFKVYNSGTCFYFASDTRPDMSKWMNKLGLAAIAYRSPNLNRCSPSIAVTEDNYYSESENSDDSSDVSSSSSAPVRERENGGSTVSLNSKAKDSATTTTTMLNTAVVGGGVGGIQKSATVASVPVSGIGGTSHPTLCRQGWGGSFPRLNSFGKDGITEHHHHHKEHSKTAERRNFPVTRGNSERQLNQPNTATAAEATTNPIVKTYSNKKKGQTLGAYSSSPYDIKHPYEMFNSKGGTLPVSLTKRKWPGIMKAGSLEWKSENSATSVSGGKNNDSTAETTTRGFFAGLWSPKSERGRRSSVPTTIDNSGNSSISTVTTEPLSGITKMALAFEMNLDSSSPPKDTNTHQSSAIQQENNNSSKDANNATSRYAKSAMRLFGSPKFVKKFSKPSSKFHCSTPTTSNNNNNNKELANLSIFNSSKHSYNVNVNNNSSSSSSKNNAAVVGVASLSAAVAAATTNNVILERVEPPLCSAVVVPSVPPVPSASPVQTSCAESHLCSIVVVPNNNPREQLSINNNNNNVININIDNDNNNIIDLMNIDVPHIDDIGGGSSSGGNISGSLAVLPFENATAAGPVPSSGVSGSCSSSSSRPGLGAKKPAMGVSMIGKQRRSSSQSSTSSQTESSNINKGCTVTVRTCHHVQPQQGCGTMTQATQTDEAKMVVSEMHDVDGVVVVEDSEDCLACYLESLRHLLLAKEEELSLIQDILSLPKLPFSSRSEWSQWRKENFEADSD